ncbi:hypothetical protein NOVO_01390 [Rickettsiales bacterium Ac37b]|nr:hypothetical protein NOVO_01390 [Rickettsiales bacterium Ac37b]
MDNNNPDTHNDKNEKLTSATDEKIKPDESKKLEEQKIQQEDLKKSAEKKQKKEDKSKNPEQQKLDQLKEQKAAKEKEAELEKDKKLEDIKNLISDARRAMANGNFDSAYSLLNSAQDLIASTPMLKGTSVENSIQTIKSEMVEMRSGYGQREQTEKFAEQAAKEQEEAAKLLQNRIDLTCEVIEKADKHLYKNEEHKLQINKIREKHKRGEKLEAHEEKEYHEVLHKKFEENPELHKAAHEHAKQTVKQLEEHKSQYGLNEDQTYKLTNLKAEIDTHIFDEMAYNEIKSKNKTVNKEQSPDKINDKTDTTKLSEDKSVKNFIESLSSGYEKNSEGQSIGNLSPPNLPNNKPSPSIEKS